MEMSIATMVRAIYRALHRVLLLTSVLRLPGWYAAKGWRATPPRAERLGPTRPQRVPPLVCLLGGAGLLERSDVLGMERCTLRKCPRMHAE